MNPNEVVELTQSQGAPTSPFDTPFDPIRHIANQIWQLNYAALMTIARDLHSDSEALGKEPHEIAELLSRWAKRQVDGQQ